MDNLDISDSLSSSFPWLPYGAQFTDYHVNGDFGYFSQRSAMLEPIIEETSDDDDVSCGHVWTHNDNQWSSPSSDAGSVIRVELIQGKNSAVENKRKKLIFIWNVGLCSICIWKSVSNDSIEFVSLLKCSISVNRKWNNCAELVERNAKQWQSCANAVSYLASGEYSCNLHYLDYAIIRLNFWIHKRIAIPFQHMNSL